MDPFSHCPNKNKEELQYTSHNKIVINHSTSQRDTENPNTTKNRSLKTIIIK